jgi:DNA-binding MarR family transcriptional regulator
LSRGKSSTGKSLLETGGAIRVSGEYAARYSSAAARATECVLNLIRTADQLLEAVGRLWREQDLSVSAGNALMIVVGAPEPLAPKVVSERMLVTRGAVTGLLDVLESRGLVRRQPNADDRRMLLVAPTPRGRHLAQTVQPRIVELEVELLGVLSSQEQEQLIGMLGRLQGSVARWRAERIRDSH